MRTSSLKMLVAAAAFALIAAPSYALTINDPGVVGSVFTGTQSANDANRLEWANYLLSLGASTTVTVDGNTPADGVTEEYQTSSTNYTTTLGGGTSLGINVTAGVISSYQYVLIKYDGKNAGYVLFNVADWTAGGGTDLPSYPASLWTTNPEQYAISGAHGYGSSSVPDGGTTLSLLGLAFAGIGVARRYMSA